MPGKIQTRTKSLLQLTKFAVVFMAMAIPFTQLARADDCVTGTWQLDEESSELLTRYTEREAKSYKKRAPASSPSSRAKRTQKPDGAPPAETGMPGFVFDPSALDVTVDESTVTFKSPKQNRQFSTIGETRQVSLSNLNKSHSVIAGWEDKQLIVETTTPYGAYIVENFQLNDLGALVVYTQVANGFSRPFEFTKRYLRQEPVPKTCLERFQSVSD